MGDAVVTRYEGPAANGIPDQFYIAEAIATKEELMGGVALITDGRSLAPPGVPPSVM